jgi:TorA maturation chaperone TorD
MENTDMGKVAATADVYRLLSACFYQPEKMFLEEDIFGQLEKALSCCAPQLREGANRLGAAFGEESIEALLLDYSRLFLGPFEIQAKPYGSVYLDGEKIVMGDSTMDALACYRRGGFSPADDFKEMPDHIAVELEFLYLLCFRQAGALAERNSVVAAENQALRREFLRNHLGVWAAKFSSRVAAAANSGFYRRLAELLEAFVPQAARQG